MIKAAIFDMDGLIIDSEPLWEATYVKRLVALGVPREEITKTENKGTGAREFFEHWYITYPWGKDPSPEALAHESVTKVEQLIRQNGRALPGVINTIKLLRSRNITLAIASSSPLHLIEVAVDQLQIREYFDYFHTGATEDFAKPHPAIFIHTANEMNISYPQCLVFEDSLNGVIAAKAARMVCIAVPDAIHRSDPRYCIADKILDSLEEFNLQFLSTL